MMFKRFGKKLNNSGLTLVELLVVLIVLGILASASVYALIGYINLTRFNKNNETAQSIYQSAQSSLTHMSENGMMNDWAFKLSTDNNGIVKYGTPVYSNTSNPGINDAIYTTENATKFDIFPNTPDTQRGLSVHMRYALTYKPGSSDKQSELISALIMDDLKSTDVLNGIITIEFDVEKKLDSNGKLHYDANVISVFYDGKRKSWDNIVYKDLTDKTVPLRDETYRKQSSYLGYFGDSTEIAAVDNVYVPNDAEIKDVIFTLRNGETLDMSWSVTSEDDDAPKTGVPEHFHYLFSLYDTDYKDGIRNNSDSDIANDWPFCYLVVEENSIHNGNTHNGKPTNILNSQGFRDELKANLYGAMGLAVDSTFVPAAFANINGKTSNALINNHNYNVVYTSEKITDENGTPINIYKVSTETVAKVYVHKVTKTDDSFNYDLDDTSKPDLDSNYYTFPLKISYDVYEISGRILSERVSYTLSLDAMMSRSIWSSDASTNANDKTTNYSISRLYSNKLSKQISAKNIFAKMQVLPNNFQNSLTDPAYNYPTSKPFTGSDVFFAERAFDDPVYLLQDGKIPVYRYGDYGQPDYGKGYAIVNTFFGDIANGSLGASDFVAVGGTYSGGDAIITSYRHLYNIRMVSELKNVPITYRIKRDLNWFSIYNELGSEKYYSEVVVYTGAGGVGSTTLVGHSPVPVPDHATNPTDNYGDILNVVSFPSIPTFNANSKLIAEDNNLNPDTDATSVINNVQMRLASFSDKDGVNAPGYVATLKGYGLINENLGTVINIRINGLTLNFNSTPDGSPDDRDRSGSAETFQGIVDQVFSSNLDYEEALSFTGSHPAGGLIGANNGTVGDSSDPADATVNTIRMSNCIVTSAFWDGSKWKVYKTSAIGGIIGDNGNVAVPGGGKVYGHLETTGCFVTAGWVNVSSAIGYAVTSIDADIKVDNTNHITDDKFKNDPDYASAPFVDEYGSKPIMEFSDVSGKKVHSVLYASADAIGAAVGSAGPSNPSSISDIIPCHFKQMPSPLTMSADSEGKVSVTGDSGEYAIDVKLGEGSFIIMKTDNHAKYPKRQTGIGGAVGRITHCEYDNLSVRVVNNGYIISSEGSSGCKHMGGAVGVISNCISNNIDISVINNGSIGPDSIANISSTVHSVGGAVGKIDDMQSDSLNIRIFAVNNGDIWGDCTNVATYNGGGYYNGDDKNQGGIGGAIGTFTSSKGKLPVMMVRSVYASGTISGKTPATDAPSSCGIGGAVGYIEYIPLNSHFYSSVAAGLSITSTGNNVGGCLGCQVGKAGTYPNLGTTITADLAGGNTITSGSSNAGGAAGNIESVDAGLTVLAKTGGNLTVEADKNAGGVSGRVMPHSDSPTSEFILKPTAAYKINITATTESAGGIIGFSDCFVDNNKTYNASSIFGSTMTLPVKSFSAADTLTVTAGKNAGGMIGRFKSAYGFASNISVIFNSITVIEALDENAGGCIGLMEADGKYSFNLKSETLAICDPATTVTNAPYDQKIIAANKNAGGVIGCMSGKGSQIIDSEISFNSCNVKILCEKKENVGTPAETTTYGTNIGGCIGTLSNGAILNGTVRVGPDTAPDPADPAALPLPVVSLQGSCIGSCIGYCENSMIGGKVITGFAYINLSGATGIGGCIGKISGNTALDGSKFALNSGAEITFNTSDALINGDSEIGGCVGNVSESADIRGTIQFNASNVKIGPYTVDSVGNPVASGGTNTYTGGVIGCASRANIKDHAKIIFNGSDCIISGGDKTGGVFGAIENSSESTSDAEYKFTGTRTVIKGAISTGGIMGASVSSCNKSAITMDPNVSISIIGTNNVGGCVGLGSSNKNDSANNQNTANLMKKDTLKLTLSDKCKMTIQGVLSTGGILGVSENYCYYSGAIISVTGGANLLITSTSGVAGGNVGCLSSSTNMGGSSVVKISCNGSGSSIKISGHEGAGGAIGQANNTGNNQFETNFNVTSNASFTIESDSVAGGIIGVNYSKFGRNNANISLPSGGGELHINSSGSAGALVGRNLDGGKCTGSSNYSIRAILNNGSPAQLDSKAFLIGNSTGYESFKYVANTMENSQTHASITAMTNANTPNVLVNNSL